ncbi:MAG: hypothetical protein HY234_12435 [Acidobacteria bacterium]|nr:hypothetical protein [Acidobacteriota bacterium]
MLNAAKHIVKRMLHAVGLEIRRLPREESANEVIYSAYDEQSIIQGLIEQLPSEPKVCVDIGASDGISCSNT